MCQRLSVEDSSLSCGGLVTRKPVFKGPKNVWKKCWYWELRENEKLHHPLFPWESVCTWVSGLCVLVCDTHFCNINFCVYSSFGRWRGKGYCSKTSQRHGNSLILSTVHGLEIIAYVLAKMLIHIPCNILWKMPNDLFAPILFTD